MIHEPHRQPTVIDVIDRANFWGISDRQRSYTALRGKHERRMLEMQDTGTSDTHREGDRIVRCASTLQIIAEQGSWSRLANGVLCRYFRPIAGLSVALYGLSVLLKGSGDSYHSPAIFARTAALVIAGLWLVTFFVHDVIGSIRFRILDRKHSGDSDNARVWIGRYLGPAEVLEEIRIAPCPTLVSARPLSTRFASNSILGVALSLALVSVLAAVLLGGNPVVWLVGATGLFICVIAVEPHLFPNRMKIGPGRLQTVRASVITKTVSVEHDVALKDAAVTVFSMLPTRVVIRWYVGTRQEKLRINNIPKELCFYVWLASVSKNPQADFASPVLGEALVGVTHAKSAK